MVDALHVPASTAEPPSERHALASFGPQRRRIRPFIAFNPLFGGLMTVTETASKFAPRRARPLKQGGPWRVLFCNLAHLGDVTIQLPLMARLKASPQVARLDMLAGPVGAAMFDALPIAERVHVIDNWAISREPGGRFGKILGYARARAALIQTLRDQQYDIAIDTFGLMGNASTLLWGAHIPIRCGFNTTGASGLSTDVVDWAFDEPISMAQRAERLLDPLLRAGLTLPDVAPMPFSPDAKAMMQIGNLGPYAVLHLGRGDHMRRWDFGAWREVALALRARGLHIVFTGSAAEADYGRELRAEIGGLDLLGAGGMAHLATVLKNARVLVSVETLSPHLAGLFQTPTVVITKAREPVPWWRPPHPFVRQVWFKTACAPCFQSNGCEAMACVRMTPAEAVIAGVWDVLAQVDAHKAGLA